MSKQRLIDATGLPATPLDAAGAFHAAILPQVRVVLAEQADVVLHFAAADHTHAGWRLAMVQELAREAAPARVNAIAGGADPAILTYLANAPGVTGQIMAVAGNLPQEA